MNCITYWNNGSGGTGTTISVVVTHFGLNCAIKRFSFAPEWIQIYQIAADKMVLAVPYQFLFAPSSDPLFFDRFDVIPV